MSLLSWIRVGDKHPMTPKTAIFFFLLYKCNKCENIFYPRDISASQNSNEYLYYENISRKNHFLNFLCFHCPPWNWGTVLKWPSQVLLGNHCWRRGRGTPTFDGDKPAKPFFFLRLEMKQDKGRWLMQYSISISFIHYFLKDKQAGSCRKLWIVFPSCFPLRPEQNSVVAHRTLPWRCAHTADS